jgi:uridine kinase
MSSILGNMTSQKPYIIGLSGGSASGKTSVSKEIFDRMGVEDCLMITMDSYYRVISPEERKNLSNFNFDHPSAFDFDLLTTHLRDLLNGKTIEMPIYSFTTSSREEKTVTTKPSYLIIFEGIFALYDQRIREIMDMKIFVDTDDDVRLARRSKYKIK